jgi:serine/threonine-protein kinase
MNQNWTWIGRYVAVIVIALVLAAAFGSMDLFKTTAVIGKKLTAAHIVKFLGYGTALAVLWLLSQRAAVTLQKQGGRWSFGQYLLVPLVTLIVAASAHSVLLLVLGPLMDPGLRNVYNWLFIVGIIAAAGWVVMAIFNQSASLTEAVASAAKQATSAKGTSCPKCGAPAGKAAKFCSNCGAALTG